MTDVGRIAQPGEQGDGVLSTFVGVLMFLVFLLFTVQVTTHLHATTVVTTAAFDSARLASAADPAARACAVPSAASLERASAHFTDLVGGLADHAAVTWAGTTSTEVVLSVAVTSPARLLNGTGVVTGLDRIERTVRLRRECVQ